MEYGLEPSQRSERNLRTFICFDYSPAGSSQGGAHPLRAASERAKVPHRRQRGFELSKDLAPTGSFLYVDDLKNGGVSLFNITTATPVFGANIRVPLPPNVPVGIEVAAVSSEPTC